MRSGYRVLWTDHALDELEEAVRYLRINFSDAEISRLAKSIESTINQITRHPSMHPEAHSARGIRRVVVLRFNSLYYRVNADTNQIEIVSFFSNRQDPEAREL